MKIDRLVEGITLRLVTVLIFSLSVLLALVFRLWYEQVNIGEAHRDAISKQSIRRIRISPVRGRIISDDGIALADNQPSYDVLFHVYEMRQPGRDSRRKTLDHVITQIHATEVRAGRPSDTALEWVGMPADEANEKMPIREALRWYGIAVRGTENTYWAESPFEKGAHMRIDLKHNTFYCEATGIHGGPIAFAAGYEPHLPDDQLVPLMAERLRLLRHVRVYPALPYQAFTALNEDQLGRVLGTFPGVKGMEVATRMRRLYPLGEIGAHILGFTSRRTDKAISDDEVRSYAEEVLGRSPDAPDDDEAPAGNLSKMVFFQPELVGRRGLEEQYDALIRGRPGGQLVRVDSVGYLHGDAGEPLPPQHGADLHLTISARAQQIGQKLLGEQQGALVVLDCRTGAVLAMVSSPTWDPGAIHRDYGELIADPLQPLHNRALRADFFPGSVVKPLIAAMAVEQGLVDPAAKLDCPGYFRKDGLTIKCSHRHEPVDTVDALKHSCNTYFITLGTELGVDTMAPIFSAVGFGRDTGFELPPPGFGPTRFGRTPDRQAKQAETGHPWTFADTAFASIGQGYFTCSALQAAMMTAAVANGGRVWRPYIVAEVRSGDGAVLQGAHRTVQANLPFSPETMRVVQEGMAAAVWGSHGTGSEARTPIFPMAGKTGTAETGRPQKHTWFIGYGPIGDPAYAIAVLIEDGSSGGKSAAPIARQFFEQYYAERAVGMSQP